LQLRENKETGAGPGEEIKLKQKAKKLKGENESKGEPAESAYLMISVRVYLNTPLQAAQRKWGRRAGKEALAEAPARAVCRK